MHKKSLFRAPLLALVGLLAVLIVPAAAQAHRIDLVASCDASANVVWKVTFVNFGSSLPTTEGTVKLDGSVDLATATAGSITSSTLAGSVPAAGNQAHVVGADFSWIQDGARVRQYKEATTNVCPDAPPPPPPPPPVTPPTPPTPPSPPTPPTDTPPGGGVLPETIVSGIARLNGPSGCVKQAFTASVSGRSIAAVAFYVDGKLVKRIARERSRYSVKVKPGSLGFGRHRVIARVTFLAESGTSARALPLTFRRCAQGAVQPRFTG